MANSPLRTDRTIWYLRLLQGLFVLIVLGVSGHSSTLFTGPNLGCASVPQRLAWNIACASLTLILVLYFIPTTGPLSKTRLWNRWTQLILDAIFLIFWIAAAATSKETCDDIWAACANTSWGLIHSGDMDCPRTVPFIGRRDIANSLLERFTSSESSSAGKDAVKLGEALLKIGLDGSLVILFALTLIVGISKACSKSNSAAVNAEEMQDTEGNKTKSGPTVTETAVPDHE